jgi:hypothetical protein
MDTNIEYNFIIISYKKKGDYLFSFDYSISMYYKDAKYGYAMLSKTFIVNEQFTQLDCVDDFISLTCKKENVDRFEDTSIYSLCFSELEKEFIECNLSYSNVSKYD